MISAGDILVKINAIGKDAQDLIEFGREENLITPKEAQGCISDIIYDMNSLERRMLLLYGTLYARLEVKNKGKE